MRHHRTWPTAALLVLALVIGAASTPGAAVASSAPSPRSEPSRPDAAPVDALDTSSDPDAACTLYLLRSSEWVVPGWYPAAEAIMVYTVAAAATYFFGRFVRISGPWWVKYGPGALWAAIEETWITGKFQPGDTLVERNYEDCNSFNSYKYHYRNGVLIRSAYREIAKSSCAEQNNFVRGLLNGTIQVSGARSKYTFCPNSYGR